MTTYKVADLTGVLLDFAVAQAEGFGSFWIAPGDDSRPAACVLGPSRADDARFDWCPSTSWEQGGRIIERDLLTLSLQPAEDEAARWIACARNGVPSVGPTPLIAAMRAYVASKFGETVELP